MDGTRTPDKELYMKRNLLIPTLLATVLATPFAFAQSVGLGVGGNAGAAVQAGPVNAGAQVQSQIDAQAHRCRASGDGCREGGRWAGWRGDQGRRAYRFQGR